MREFTVTFQEIKALQVGPGDEGTGDEWDWAEGSNEEWRIRYGVNGQWLQTPETELARNGVLPLGNKKFTVFLAPEDRLTIGVHGTEWDAIEDMFKLKDDDRTLKLDGEKVDYQRDMVKGDPPLRRRIAREMFMMQWRTLRNNSDGLARLHIEYPAALLESDTIYQYTQNAIFHDRKHKLIADGDPVGTGEYALTFTIEAKEQEF